MSIQKQEIKFMYLYDSYDLNSHYNVGKEDKTKIIICEHFHKFTIEFIREVLREFYKNKNIINNNNENIKSKLQEDIFNFLFIENPTEEQCLLALTICPNPHSIKIIEKQYQTKNVRKYAIKLSIENIRYVYKQKDLFGDGIEINENTIEYIRKEEYNEYINENINDIHINYNIPLEICNIIIKYAQI